MKTAPLNISDIITKLGGPTEAAKRLQLSSPSVVLNWRKRGSIPADRVLEIEELTGVSRHVLCPKVFGHGEQAEKIA